MKICIIRHAYFPEDPRDRKQAFALVGAGHAVQVLCLRKKKQNCIENICGVNVFRIPLSHRRTGILRYFIEYTLSFIIMSIIVFCFFLRKRFDCIQVSTMPDILVFTTIGPKLLGAKILLDLHEPTPELWITKYGNRLRPLLFLQEKIEQLAISYADRSFAVTESLRRRLGHRGADLDKITVVSNVCEEVFDEAFEDSLKEERCYSKRHFLMVTHGLIEERYGHELVIKAVKRLEDKIPSIHYNIIGDGEYRKGLIDLVKKLKCEDRVHFLGYLSFDDLLREILKTDVGIIAMKRSPYSELIDTNKMYEYIALKKPIIISRLQPVEDSFDDTCMKYFEPGNVDDLARCILDLYNDAEKRHILAKNAFCRYEKLKWNKTKMIYIKAIEKVAVCRF